MKERYNKRVQLRAWVMFSNDDLWGQGRVLNLTAPGCQIESLQKVSAGQYLQLRILLPGHTSLFTVGLAAVRWSHGNRFGAEFIKMDSMDQNTLDSFLAVHLPRMIPSGKTR